MRWNRYTIHTTTEAEDLISDMLMELGIEGIEIEDNVPLSQADTLAMFVDILPELPPDEGKAKVNFYLEPEREQAELLEKVKEGLEELRAFVDVGEGTITESQTEDKDWINNWKQYFKPFTVEDILIKPTWEELPEGQEDKLLIQIDPGTVHAIKADTLILETQQNSDITYRVYDYNRLVDGKPRQLHVSQSIDVINVPDEAYKKAIKKAAPQEPNTWNLLTESDYYKVWKLVVKDGFTFNQEHPFLIVSVLEGVGIIEGHSVGKGAHLLIPAGYGQVEMLGDMEIIASTAAEKSAEA